MKNLKLELKNKNILESNFFNKKRKEIQEKYIIIPFLNTLGLREIKIITAPMGLGKSYSIWNVLSPRYLKDKGKLHIHVAPHIETLAQEEIESYISKSFSGQDYPLVCYNDKKLNYTRIKKSLDNGRRVIITITDQSLNNEKDSIIDLLQYKNYAEHTLLTRDELSWGTTTDVYNYKNNTSNPSSKYKGTYFKNLYELFSLGCDLYGFTATPTREHLGELPIKFEENMRIINDWPELSEILLFQKWYKDLRTFDRVYEDSAIVSDITWLMDEVKERERCLESILEGTPFVDSNNKFTSMMAVETNTGSLDRVTIDKVRGIIKDNPNIIPKEYTWIITTESGWTEYDSEGCTTGNCGRNEEWLSLMNSETSSARLLVVVNKGTYGINIPSLCAGVSLKKPKGTTDDTKETIRITGLQFIGRFNRPNMNEYSWELFRKLRDKYDDELGELYLETKNTFVFKAPTNDNQYWIDTINDYKEKFGNSRGEMINYLYGCQEIKKKS